MYTGVYLIQNTKAERGRLLRKRLKVKVRVDGFKGLIRKKVHQNRGEILFVIFHLSGLITPAAVCRSRTNDIKKYIWLGGYSKCTTYILYMLSLRITHILSRSRSPGYRALPGTPEVMKRIRSKMGAVGSYAKVTLLETKLKIFFVVLV